MTKGCRRLSSSEIVAIKSVMNLRDRCLFTIGLRTGFRISEILSLNVEDVLNPNGISSSVYLKKKNTKGKNSGASVVLHPEIVSSLKEYLSDGRMIGPLFLSRGGMRLDRQGFHNALKKALKACAIHNGRVASHSMRKCFAEEMCAALDNNPYKLQKAMRHKSLDSTAKYISVDDDEINWAILNAK